MCKLGELEEAGQAFPEAGLILLGGLILNDKGAQATGQGYEEYEDYCQFYRGKEAPEETPLRLDCTLFTYHQLPM